MNIEYQVDSFGDVGENFEHFRPIPFFIGSARDGDEKRKCECFFLKEHATFAIERKLIRSIVQSASIVSLITHRGTNNRLTITNDWFDFRSMPICRSVATLLAYFCMATAFESHISFPFYLFGVCCCCWYDRRPIIKYGDIRVHAIHGYPLSLSVSLPPAAICSHNYFWI